MFFLEFPASFLISLLMSSVIVSVVGTLEVDNDSSNCVSVIVCTLLGKCPSDADAPFMRGAPHCTSCDTIKIFVMQSMKKSFNLEQKKPKTCSVVAVSVVRLRGVYR